MHITLCTSINLPTYSTKVHTSSNQSTKTHSDQHTTPQHITILHTSASPPSDVQHTYNPPTLHCNPHHPLITTGHPSRPITTPPTQAQRPRATAKSRCSATWRFPRAARDPSLFLGPPLADAKVIGPKVPHHLLERWVGVHCIAVQLQWSEMDGRGNDGIATQCWGGEGTRGFSWWCGWRWTGGRSLLGVDLFRFFDGKALFLGGSLTSFMNCDVFYCRICG